MERRSFLATVGLGVFLLAWGWVFPEHNPTVRGTGIGFLTIMGFLFLAIGATEYLVDRGKRRRMR